MTSVGIRELRQRASELLRLVEQGETIEITDRGRPVAHLSPIKDNLSPYERLLAEGLIIPATGNGIENLPPPLPVPPGVPSPSEVLAKLREHER